MKSTLFACLAALSATTVVRAGPAELAIVAATKVADSPNYTWSTTVDDDARTYAIDGQTNLADKNDLSLVNMPMVAAVRRRLTRGSTNSDTQMTAIFTSDEKLVIQTADGWRKPDQ